MQKFVGRGAVKLGPWSLCEKLDCKIPQAVCLACKVHVNHCPPGHGDMSFWLVTFSGKLDFVVLSYLALGPISKSLQFCLTEISYQPNFHKVSIVATSAPLIFGWAKKYTKQYFLFNSLMKFGPRSEFPPTFPPPGCKFTRPGRACAGTGRPHHCSARHSA